MKKQAQRLYLPEQLISVLGIRFKNKKYCHREGAEIAGASAGAEGNQEF